MLQSRCSGLCLCLINPAIHAKVVRNIPFTKGQSEMAGMIEVRNLSKTFVTKDANVEALQNINLSIQTGDIYGIIGMSGVPQKERWRSKAEI